MVTHDNLCQLMIAHDKGLIAHDTIRDQARTSIQHYETTKFGLAREGLRICRSALYKLITVITVP